MFAKAGKVLSVLLLLRRLKSASGRSFVRGILLPVSEVPQASRSSAGGKCMDRKRRYFVRWEPPARWKSAFPDEGKPLQDVELAMTFTFAKTLELRSTTSQIVAHSQRVSGLVGAIAELVEVRGGEQERLRLAA